MHITCYETRRHRCQHLYSSFTGRHLYVPFLFAVTHVRECEFTRDQRNKACLEWPCVQHTDFTMNFVVEITKKWDISSNSGKTVFPPKGDNVDTHGMMPVQHPDTFVYHIYNHQKRESAVFFPEGPQILPDFDQKSLHFPKCLLSMNNNDIIVYN